MKIDLIANDGSPIGVTPDLIWSRGVGGAELAMMTLMATLSERGHEVTVYNDPTKPGDHDGVTYANLAGFDLRNARDVLIIFRSPNPRYVARHRGSCRAVWWSTDQFTVGNFPALAQSVDDIVCISPFHSEYFASRYGISRDKMHVIDLGVRIRDYSDEIEKIRDRMIFCSIPDRGLDVLHAAWPLVHREVPNASLVVTSDYRLWGNPHPGNQKHRLMWASQPNVIFTGAVPRKQLVRLQMEAEIMSYPCTYEELFCISAAECSVAGALPVTSEFGALPTTNEFGIIIPGDPKTPSFVDLFSERIVSLLTAERSYLSSRQAAASTAGRRRFDWERIAESWEAVFKGESTP